MSRDTKYEQWSFDSFKHTICIKHLPWIIGTDNTKTWTLTLHQTFSGINGVSKSNVLI